MVQRFKKKNCYSIIYQGDKQGFIDAYGNVICYPRYLNVHHFYNGYASVKKEENIWALVDTKGKEIFQYECSYMGDFSEGYIIVAKNGEWGFIDINGNEVLGGLKYRQVHDFIEGYAAVSENIDVNGDGSYFVEKWGFIDVTGKEICNVKYSIVRAFHNGRAMVYFNGKIGFIDTTGKEICKIEYDYAHDFKNGYARVQKGDETNFLDLTGREICRLGYDNAEDFDADGVARVMIKNRRDNREYWGVIDKTGREICRPMYLEITPFENGIASVAFYRTDDFYLRYNLIDKTGRQICESDCKYIEFFVFEGVIRAELYDSEKTDFIDKTGRALCNFKYDYATTFNNGYAQVRLDDKYGFIDESGREVFGGLKYDYVSEFRRGYAIVVLGEKYGLIDTNGREVCEIKYDSGSFYDGRDIPVYSYHSRNSDESDPLCYKEGDYFCNGYSKVKLNGLYGLIDHSGQEVLNCEYEWIGDVKNGVARVNKGGEYMDANLTIK